MTLNPAKTSDKPQLYELHVNLFRDHIEKIWGWDEDWQIANFQKEWDDSRTEVIQVDGNVVGCVQTRLEADHIYVLNLAIGNKHQGLGLGSAVMNALKERATTQALPIQLSVFRTNQRVIAFYERLEFGIVEETETGCKMHWPKSSY